MVGKYLVWHKSANGFTIVELLIVIVIIGILAALVLTTFSNIQQQARDSKRRTDVQAIAKALELYYADNGQYPPGSGSTTINGSWSTTADTSWANLETALSPYLRELPQDPVDNEGVNPLSGTNLAYSYFANLSGTYCGSTSRQMYLFIYRLESGAQENTLKGSCNTNPLGPYANRSNYRVNNTP